MTPGGGALERIAATHRPAIEEALVRSVAALAPPLGSAALYAVRAGGKRLRPLLTVACYRAARRTGDDAPVPAAVYRVAAAVELIHTYSLLHDDLPAMDDDPLRRGLPTTHLVYGERVATATGCALQQLAFLELARAAHDDPELGRAMPALTRALARGAGVEGMVGGQLLDLLAEGRNVDGPGLEAIHRAKTAALMSAACGLGALAGAASAEVRAALESYGTDLGLAFQIVDDVLDVVGEPTRTGKARGADAGRGKATYPAVYGLERARRLARDVAERARASLDRLDGGPDPVLEAFVEFVVERIH